MFSSEETSLLQELVEKYLNNLDTSLTRDSIETRKKAWDSITDEFNWANVNDIPRDQLELKTKLKNLKAQRLIFKSEKIEEMEKSVVSESINADPLAERRFLRIKGPLHNSLPASQSTSNPTRQKMSNESILDSLEDCDDTDDDEDVS